MFHRIHQQCLPTFPRFAPSPKNGFPLNYPHEPIFHILHRSIIVFQTCMLGHKGLGFVHPTPSPLQPLGGKMKLLHAYYILTTILDVVQHHNHHHRVEGREDLLFVRNFIILYLYNLLKYNIIEPLVWSELATFFHLTS